jgi:hypothetical protein
MAFLGNGSRVKRLGVQAALCLALLCGQAPLRAQAKEKESAAQPSPLTAEQVIANLTKKNQERARALGEVHGTRTYRMQYRGFPSNRDAEMVVKADYKAPDQKEFTIVSQTGSKFVIERVFMKLLEGEKEALKPDNRERTALNTSNYNFTLDKFEPSASGGEYELTVTPKSSNKFLYHGKIWVDGKDFAVTRIDAEPAKNPSFWIKKSEIQHKYVKVDDFWLPAENHTESYIRLGGRAILSIEYTDYKITQADPLNRKAEGADQQIHSDLIVPTR